MPRRVFAAPGNASNLPADRERSPLAGFAWHPVSSIPPAASPASRPRGSSRLSRTWRQDARTRSRASRCTRWGSPTQADRTPMPAEDGPGGVALQVGSPAARRLHYWTLMVNGGRIVELDEV